MHSFTAIVATVLSAIVAVEAGPQHTPMGNYARHAAVIRRNPLPVLTPVDAPKWSRRSNTRRCMPKGAHPPKPAGPSTPAPSTSGGGSGGSGSGSGGGSSGNGGGSGGSGSGNGGGNGGGNGAMINFSWNGPCPVNPSGSASNDGGVNGSEDFLNCGMNSGGWIPPNVQLSNLVYMDLRQAIQDPASPFSACSALIDAFESVGQDIGIPPILLASFAMQESSCNPSATGGAGEIGLMQITPDKCTGNCYDPWNNLNIGARYFKTVLDSHNGNVLQAMGEYNGWFQGMNPGDVVNRPCPQQQNLDYLHHVCNFWMQNRDPNGAGTQRNKQACGGY